VPILERHYASDERVVKPNRLLDEPPFASREIVRIDWGIVYHPRVSSSLINFF
jgi:hypothetical protein